MHASCVIITNITERPSKYYKEMSKTEFYASFIKMLVAISYLYKAGIIIYYLIV